MNFFKLTQQAENDLTDIWAYIYQNWGKVKANQYLDKLEARCRWLKNGHILVRSHDDIHPGLKSIPCEHHFIFYLHQKGRIPIVVAFYYERMDFIRRLKRRLK